MTIAGGGHAIDPSAMSMICRYFNKSTGAGRNMFSRLDHDKCYLLIRKARKE